MSNTSVPAQSERGGGGGGGGGGRVEEGGGEVGWGHCDRGKGGGGGIEAQGAESKEKIHDTLL